MNRVALIAIVIMGVGFAHGALAADLPVRAAPVYQAPVAVAPTWTRLYVGASAEQTVAGVRYKPPKSGRGRAIALSATVSAELGAHRRRQAEELLRLGIRQSDATFVYTREDGEPMQPRSLTRAWEQALSRTTLPRIRFHDLRHAHATHLLSNGVHPKERLGHSRVGITLDLYSHVLPGMQEDAAARVDDALRQAVEKRATEGIG
jgi:integrase